MKGKKEMLSEALASETEKEAEGKEFGLLLSGGIDSALLGKILSGKGKKFNCYFTGIREFSEPGDLVHAKKAAKEIGMPLKTKFVPLEEYEKSLPKIVSIVGTPDPVIVGVCSVIYFATHAMKEKYAFTGTGSDELFGGYDRFRKSKNYKKDSGKALQKLFEKDLKAFKGVAHASGKELVSPYLSKKIVSEAKKIPKKSLIDSHTNKKILREAALGLGLSKKLAFRPKKAAQYGSNFDRAIAKLSKKNGFSSKSSYLASLLNKKIAPLKTASLISTGKDSLYAMHIARQKGHSIECFITISSENPDSFMYHTPSVELARLQAKAAGIPIITRKTPGEKEKELKELESAFREAKKLFGVGHVTTGALFSEYQRDRIQKICDKLGIECVSPLWHKDQQEYMEELAKSDFEVIINKIACYGLDKSFLGAKITPSLVKKLVSLKDRIGTNVAGEGGEFETLVLDMPLFKKKLRVVDSEKKMENEFTGVLEIKKAELCPK